MEKYNFFLLDTFTKEAFKGNPTPVCLLDHPLDEETMTRYAKEFNCPVSVFIYRERDDPNYQIRYCTVTGEIPACGHGTLAAAYVLLGNGLAEDTVQFQTMEGISLVASKRDGLVFLEYPVYQPVAIETPSAVIEALGQPQVESFFYCSELAALFLELETVAAIKSVQPDYERLRQSSDTIKEVVIMCASADHKSDVTLRSFCPWIGIDEDPVTGSIHSVLGPYWEQRLDQEMFTVYQASDRGGTLVIRSSAENVQIGGDCQLIISGFL